MRPPRCLLPWWRGVGFTLIELLVAMMVLAVLVVTLLGLVDASAKLWRENSSRAEAYQEARAALDVMTRDLGNRLKVKDTNTFLLNEHGAFSRLPPDAEAHMSRAGALFFLVALPPEAREPESHPGDVCEVGYFLGFGLAREALTGAPPTMNLYRYLRSGNPTFSNLAASNALFQDAAMGPGGEELLARNIRSFRVTPLSYASNAYTTNFIPSAAKPHPDALEITIVAAGRETARRFSSKSDWTTAPPAALTNAEHAFTTRILLH